MFLSGSDSYWLQGSDEDENWRNMIYWFNEPEMFAEFLGEVEFSTAGILRVVSVLDSVGK